MIEKIADIHRIDIILAGINLVFLIVGPIFIGVGENGSGLIAGTEVIRAAYLVGGIGILMGVVVGVADSNWYIALLSVFLGTIVGILYEACSDWSRFVEVDIKGFDLDRFMTIPLIPWLIGLGIGKLIDWIRYR